jgi:hypothetical protein
MLRLFQSGDRWIIDSAIIALRRQGVIDAAIIELVRRSGLDTAIIPVRRQVDY